MVEPSLRAIGGRPRAATTPGSGQGLEGGDECVGQVGNDIIAAFGFDPGAGDTLTTRIYDIASGTWSAVAPLPSARSDLAAKTKGGKIYVFGGCAGGVFPGNIDI
jgi:hypothetical protein